MFLCDIIDSSTHLYMCVWHIHVPYTCTYIYMYMPYMYKMLRKCTQIHVQYMYVLVCTEVLHMYMYMYVMGNTASSERRVNSM